MRAAALAVAAFVVVGPLAGLVVWSLAERWTAGSPWPQRFGLRYWARMPTGDFLEPLTDGAPHRGHRDRPRAAPRRAPRLRAGPALVPGPGARPLAFLLPQAFPQLPVFASATREFYRWGLAGTVSGVVLVHLVGGLVFACGP